MCLLRHTTGIIHFNPHILTFDLRIKDMNLGLLQYQIPHNKHGGCLTYIPRVLLEGISQDGNLFAGDSVEHTGDHLFSESLLLVIIHYNDLIPILGAFMQPISFTQVDQVKNILLEARSSKPNGGIKETPSNTLINPHRTGNLINIRPSRLTQCRNGIDTRHPLRQEGIGHQLTQLTRPQISRQDLLPWHPIGIDTHQSLRRLDPILILHTTNQHTVRRL
mmetsp:Transcript_16648/g.24646  ORF Transcript_16648/g.24646 Transcript_16648/m.24646 type:complete len:220 (-) Transcript_16648:343-1002(-)